MVNKNEIVKKRIDNQQCAVCGNRVEMVWMEDMHPENQPEEEKISEMPLQGGDYPPAICESCARKRIPEEFFKGLDPELAEQINDDLELYFQPELMSHPKIEQFPVGTSVWSSLVPTLTKIANDLDKKGLYDEADMIDQMITSLAIEPPALEEEEEAPVKRPPSPLDAPSPVQRPDDLAELKRKYEQLQKEHELLKLKEQRQQASGGIKVSEKGAVSVYGLGKWPVTLYAGQWERLLARKEEIEKFIAEHRDMLAKKTDVTK